MGAPLKNSDWPTPQDYDSALLTRRESCSDRDIQSGTLKELNPDWPLHLNAGGSAYVLVYQVGKYIVRCFTADQTRNAFPPQDIAQRYMGITAYQQRAKREGQDLPFLTYHTWVEPGFKIKSISYPFLKIPYVEQTLRFGDFLINQHHSRETVHTLKEQWLTMMQQLEQAKIAHGDLDLSNVLVKGSYPNLSLHLIDFDGMYVTDLANKGMGVAEKGHPHFQHPQTSRTFGPEMDRFSALVIYLSLCALEMKPALWDSCHATEHQLLLGAPDFKRLAQSANFALLRQEKPNHPLQNCLDALQESIDKEQFPLSLSTILNLPAVQSPPYVLTPSPDPFSSSYSWSGRMIPLPLDEGVDVDQVYQPTPILTPAPTHTSAPSPYKPAQYPTPTPTPSPAPAKINWLAVLIIVAIIVALIILASTR